MASTYFKLDGVTIKTPDSFKISRYNITKSNRLANGKMSMELIAKKLKFYLTWSALDTVDKEKIMNILWSNKLFFKFEYIEDGVWKSAVVYAGELATDLHKARPSNWVWKDVEIHLIEQ